MTPEQQAAYINAQTAAVQAEIAGMVAENTFREMNGETIAYGHAAFRALIDEYGISHNAVVGFFRDL